MPILSIFFHGALRVVIDDETGRVLGVQDRISGEAAVFRFSPDYIAAAESFARAQWAALSDTI